MLILFWFWSQSNLGGCVGGSSRGESWLSDRVVVVVKGD